MFDDSCAAEIGCTCNITNIRLLAVVTAPRFLIFSVKAFQKKISQTLIQYLENVMQISRMRIRQLSITMTCKL